MLEKYKFKPGSGKAYPFEVHLIFNAKQHLVALAYKANKYTTKKMYSPEKRKKTLLEIHSLS